MSGLGLGLAYRFPNEALITIRVRVWVRGLLGSGVRVRVGQRVRVRELG